MTKDIQRETSDSQTLRNFAFNQSLTQRQSLMGASDAVGGEPSFESKLDMKEQMIEGRKAASNAPQRSGILKSTSFFVRALENEQNEISRREDKRAQIDALQAELDSPMVPPSGKLPTP